MSDRYQLRGLGNSELLAGLSALARQSNELTAQLLAHLVELEERMLHLELGYSSLFSFCVEALGMSEGAAGRRVAAARVCRRIPGVFERIARGQMHLCALCALAPHLTADNATELLDACRGKTRRQVEELLAVRFPRPDVREQIRRLPARTAVVTAAEQSPAISLNPPSPPPSLVETPVAKSSPASATIPESRRRARELEPLSAERFGVHFTADAELRELIERARALASHRLPNGDLASLMKLMATCFVRQEEKRRFGIGARPRRKTSRTKVESKDQTALRAKSDATLPVAVESAVKPSQPRPVTPPGGADGGGLHVRPVACTAEASRGDRAKPSPERTRYLSADARREIHQRDSGRCAFVSASGQRCDARTFLQLDHVVPFARRGSNEVSNLRLLRSAQPPSCSTMLWGTAPGGEDGRQASALIGRSKL